MRGLDLSAANSASSAEPTTPWWLRVQSVLLVGAFVVLASLILVMQFLPTDQVLLEVGDVSPRDIRAPSRKSFTSQVLTERERSRAESMVRDVYDPPSAKIARDQIGRARKLFDYFDSIRHDPYSTREQKIGLIQAIPDLSLSSAVAGHILDLNAKNWQVVADQTIYVLDQTMRKEIRDNQLIEVKRVLPASVSLDLSDVQAETVIAVARDLVRPNSLYNNEKTAAARRLARDTVSPVTQTVERGEIVLRAGDLVTPEVVETLDVFSMRQAQIQWNNIGGAVLFVVILCLILAAYLRSFAPRLWAHPQHYPLLFTLLLLFIFGAKLMVPGHTILPYLYPMASLSILVSLFFGGEAAIGVTICVALLSGFMANGSLELMTYALVGGVAASLRLVRMERVSMLLWSGVYASLANVGVILAFRLPSQNFDTIGLATLLSVGIINGVLAASLALIGLFIFGSLFGVTTSLQLLDLARPTHPLLRQLLLKAPGTYHHSILVSNLAEQAAERIGADDLLARVGAYYHDVGKTLRPYFFVDNQADGVNVHDRLDPQTSSQIIVSHVKDGLELARKHNLPRIVQDFIEQHHGMTTTNYFYRLAVQAHNGPEMVDRRRFMYPGPRPRRKEIGIVMLADSCEAAVRAERPVSPEAIDELVQKIITERLVDGELNNSDLTMRELAIIRASFVSILQGVFHPRVKYPEALQAAATAQPLLAEPSAAVTGGPAEQVQADAPEAEPNESGISGKEKVIRFRRG
jgi:cyclic-di-AMP phosphodiesterase PgpH